MLKQHRFLIPGIILAIILFAVAGGWWLSLPRGDELPASIAITPSGQEESGVLTDAYFLLGSGFSVKEETLREMLELDPAINYSLTGGGKEWQIHPAIPLRENAVYTFRVKNAAGVPVQSFAFQTRSDLLVGGVYPRDGEAYVDPRTGIEIRFNRPGVDLSKGFEILPPVSGRFETVDYTCRFIPDKPLEHNSIYRVTLKGLRSSDGAELKEPFSFSFETAEEEGAQSWEDLRAESFTASFLPGGEPRVRLYGGERQAAAEYTMTLHKYPGIKAYANVLRERDAFYRDQYGVKHDYQASADGLDEVMNTQGRLLYEDGDLYAPLPSDLSEGYYLFTLSGGEEGAEQFVQQMIQVVNLSVYTQSAGGETLFWLGDPVSGGPAAGADLELEMESGEKRTVTTDENGMASLETGEENWAYITVVREGTPAWFMGLSLQSYGRKETEKSLSGSYYAALYTDREIYLPGDEISFWGVVKSRTDAPAPETVRASLSTNWPESRLYGVTLDVAEDGTFSGSIRPGALQAGAYFLAIEDGSGGRYLERYLEISEYTKPAYEITLTTDKQIYRFGETVQFHVSAAYYDGTPAAGARLLAQCYEARLSDLPVTLDENGEASFSGVLDPAAIQPGEGRVSGWEPQYVGWSVQSADEQAVVLSQWSSFTALPSLIAAEMKYAEGSAAITTAVLDESKVLDEEWQGSRWISDFERLRGVPADIPMTLVVHKVTNRRIQTGSWYDYVNKQNVPVYETQTEETVDRTIPVSTSAGTAQVTDLPIPDSEDVSYWYELRFAGGIYGDVCTTAMPSYVYRKPGEVEYTFFPAEPEQKLAPGKTLELGVYADEQLVTDGGMALYTLVQDHMLEKGVFSGTAPLEVKEAYLPNIWVVGAYFDGKEMHVIQRADLSYDYSSKVLNLETATDKEEYRPGEEMRVTLSVTDAEGEPVKKGRAVIGVVDEAIFALSEQAVELASQLYRDIYFPNISVNSFGSRGYEEGGALYGASSKAQASESASDGALANTGGGMQTRSVFADTASFQVADVADGKAVLTLTLPDNVTSWRITAAAVTPELEAGDTVSKTAATLPFYVRPIITDTYLVGDDISISALAVGTSLTGGEGDVRYSAVLSPEGAGRQQEKSVPIGKRAAFNFGKLEAGSYKATIEAEWNGQIDRMEWPFAVAETGQLVPEIQTMPLADLSTLESAGWPVQVTVYDEDAKPAFDALAWLSRQGGQRTEAVAASVRAMELYRELRPDEESRKEGRDKRLDAIEAKNGGIAPLPAAEGDASLTARMLLAAPELCHPGKAGAFLQNVLKDPAAAPEDRVMAYVGLAASKAPVLLDMQRIYDQEGAEMEAHLRLYIGAAFARLGDFERARTIYEQADIVRSGGLCHVQGQHVIRDTAAALLLASEISHEDADGLAGYLMEQAPAPGQDGAIANLEVLAYAKMAIERAGGSAGKFSYYAGGEPKVVELEDGVASLSIGPGDVSNKFRSMSGNLYAAARVLRAGDREAGGTFATVTKTYEPVEGALTPGGQVKVTLRIQFSEDAPYGSYALLDYIPSGLRWLGGVQMVSPRSANIWPAISQDGQRITGTIYRLNPNSNDARPLDDTVVRVDGAHVRMLAESVEAAKISGTASASSEAESAAESSSAASGTEEASPSAESAAEIASEPSAGVQEGGAEIAERDPEAEAQTEDIAPEDPQAVEAPEVDSQAIPQPDFRRSSYTPVKPADPAEPGEYVFEYYLSAALPGSFVTESVWLAYEDQAVKSGRGLITVNE